jgi:hypothetical protein
VRRWRKGDARDHHEAGWLRGTLGDEWFPAGAKNELVFRVLDVNRRVLEPEDFESKRVPRVLDLKDSESGLVSRLFDLDGSE